MASKKIPVKNLIGYALIVIAAVALYRSWKQKHEAKANVVPVKK